jgi:hypothetical protein
MIHISEATRTIVLARGGQIPPAVEPDLAVWSAAEAKRRAQIEEEERRKLGIVPRSSSVELQRGNQLHENRPWVERSPPPRRISVLEQARRDRLKKMAAILSDDLARCHANGNGDDVAQLAQQEITEAVLARVHSRAITVPGPEFDIRGMKLDRLSDSKVAALAHKSGVRPWDPEQLRSLFSSAVASNRRSERPRSRRTRRGQARAMGTTLADVVGGVDISGVRRAWGTPNRT